MFAFLGINTGIVPLYLSEISPFNLRGGIGVFNQLGVTVGILLSQILGLPIVLGRYNNLLFI